MMLLVFGTMFPASNRLVQRSRFEDLASQACQTQLEYYREAGYASLPNIRAGSSQSSVAFTAPTDLPSGLGGVSFTNVDSAFNSTSATSGRVRMDATVSWLAAGEVRRTITVTTVVLR